MHFSGISKHPHLLPSWLFSEFTERLCFFSIKLMLALIMINALHIPEEESVLTVAMFSSYCYLTPIIGAFIADRWLSHERAAIVGSALISLGYFMISLPQDEDLFMGLSIVITGMGLYKSFS